MGSGAMAYMKWCGLLGYGMWEVVWGMGGDVGCVELCVGV